jgi:hypothetical protein
MPLTKAEKFRLLSGGTFEATVGGVSQASTTNAKTDSRNSKTTLQNELVKPSPTASLWDTPLDGGDGFAQDTELLRSAAEARTKVFSASMRPLDIKLGQRAPPELSFCPVQAVSKYPYKHIHDKAVQDAVANSFFAGGKFFERSWNMLVTPPPSLL